MQFHKSGNGSSLCLMQFHHWPTAVLKAVTALEFPVQDIIWCRVGFGKKICRLGVFFIQVIQVFSVFQVQGGDECCFLKHPGTPAILVSTCPALRLGSGSGWILIRYLLEWLEDMSKRKKIEWMTKVCAFFGRREAKILGVTVANTNLSQIELGILCKNICSLELWQDLTSAVPNTSTKVGTEKFAHCQPSGSSPMSISWRTLPVNQIQVNLREVWQHADDSLFAVFLGFKRSNSCIFTCFTASVLGTWIFPWFFHNIRLLFMIWYGCRRC